MGKSASAFAEQKKVLSPQGGFALRNSNLGSLVKQQRIRIGLTGVNPYDWTERVRRVWRANPLFA